MSFSLRRKGVSAWLSDSYIAVAAQSAGAGLLTTDKHFTAIIKATGLTMYSQ